MQIEPLREKDLDEAVSFAVTGMHFDVYLENPLAQRLYGRYFWYMEGARATQVIAAYEDDVLAGVLLAEMYGERPQGASPLLRAYVALVELAQRLFFRGSAGVYDEVNREMLDALKAGCELDGEIIFLAANPGSKTRGIGTLLLEELAARERGKRVFLFTSDLCTYQFYERRDFELAGERMTELDMRGRTVPLRCLLYTKVL